MSTPVMVLTGGHVVTERAKVAQAAKAHADRLRARHADGSAQILPGAHIADLIITLERASAGLR